MVRAAIPVTKASCDGCVKWTVCKETVMLRQNIVTHWAVTAILRIVNERIGQIIFGNVIQSTVGVFFDAAKDSDVVLPQVVITSAEQANAKRTVLE